jgi:hypothetical protein
MPGERFLYHARRMKHFIWGDDRNLDMSGDELIDIRRIVHSMVFRYWQSRHDSDHTFPRLHKLTFKSRPLNASHLPNLLRLINSRINDIAFT